MIKGCFSAKNGSLMNNGSVLVHYNIPVLQTSLLEDTYIRTHKHTHNIHTVRSDKVSTDTIQPVASEES